MLLNEICLAGLECIRRSLSNSSLRQDQREIILIPLNPVLLEKVENIS